jgi:carbonic anhydrase
VASRCWDWRRPGGWRRLPTSTAPKRRAAPAHTAEALLLSCMDYRLIDDIAHYMDGRGMTNQYDHVVLAGASLGALTGDFKDWNKTFWEHLKIASDLHHIKKVILLDHRDCGAYKVILKADFSKESNAGNPCPWQVSARSGEGDSQALSTTGNRNPDDESRRHG